jgi:hypothetical protein
MDELTASITQAARAAQAGQRDAMGALSYGQGLSTSYAPTGAGSYNTVTDGITADLQSATKALSDSFGEASQAATKLAHAHTAASIAGGFDKASSALSGGAAGLLSLAGPYGAAAGAALNFADTAKQILPGLTDAIVASFEALPEVLEKLIPAFIKELVTELPPALAKVFLDLINPFNGDSSKEGSFAAAHRGAAVSTVGQYTNARTQYATGGYVDRTGYALLHAGEEVRQRGRAGGAAARGFGGGGVTIPITINGYASAQTVRDLVRELRNVLGGSGLNEAF